MNRRSSSRFGSRAADRKGAILVLSAFLIVFLFICLAFAVDLGYVCVVRTEAQACADSAALAAAWEIISEDRLRGDSRSAYIAARDRAAEFAALNKVGPHRPNLQKNYFNTDLNGDVLIGRLESPRNLNEQLSFDDPWRFNTVQVRVRATADRNQRSPFFFAKAFGLNSFDMRAEAVATFDDNVVGFRALEDVPNPSLLPFVVKLDDWRSLMQRGGPDDWSYDADLQRVAARSDGIPELNMFPLNVDSDGSIAGNWGTVDVGKSGNSTADLERQIIEGPNARDLEPYGGVLALDERTGTLELNGETGISAGIRDALLKAAGRPRTIPLYDTVSKNGNTSQFVIVGFAGIRIVDSQLTGKTKFVRVQPAYVFDKTAITNSRMGESYFVGQPVHLVR